MVNVAPPEDDEDRERAIVVVRAMPDLYAYDQLLYQMAKTRFAEYRRGRGTDRALVSPDDSRRACRMERGGVWLTDNWYDPEIANGKERGGAGRARERGENLAGERREVPEILGERRERDKLPRHHSRAQDTGASLPIAHTEIQDGHGMHYTIDLGQPAREDTINLLTPECYPSIVTTKDDNSLRRQSFIATDWTLAQGP